MMRPGSMVLAKRTLFLIDRPDAPDAVVMDMSKVAGQLVRDEMALVLAVAERFMDEALVLTTNNKIGWVYCNDLFSLVEPR